MQISIQAVKAYLTTPSVHPRGDTDGFCSRILTVMIFIVYHPQMPSRVPHSLFVKRIIVQLQNDMLTYLRFLLVCFIWLGLVPLLARWIWRFYFRFGDYSLLATLGSPPAAATPTEEATNTTAEDHAASAIAGQGPGTLWGEGVFGWLRGEDVWTGILRDCFQGQIITICLVAVFVVVFLIREWVMQNALEVLEEPRAVVVDEPAPQIPQAQPEVPVQPPENEGWYADDRHEDNEDEEEEEEEEPMDDVHAQNADHDERQGWLPDEAPLANPPAAPRPAHAVPPAPVRNPAVVINFDDDGDVDDDDFNGLWDILGMQGPIIGLLHNTVFSALMIALAVGLGVWLPFMFGKTVLGALAHPLDILVQHPLTMIRMSVDICVDIVLFALSGTLFSFYFLTHHLLRYISPFVPSLQRVTAFLESQEFGTTYLTLAQTSGARILQAFNSSAHPTPTATDLPALLDSSFLSGMKQHLAEYTDLSSLKGTITEKVIAVMVGYLIFTCLGAIYLRARKLHAAPGEDNTERLIRDILRQAGAVLKVVVIITIELVIFPIFCGVLIDLTTLPLFPNATIASRLEFGQRFGFTSTFLHWFAGTLYMFHFAMFVSMCRELVRAGTLYFIRDPNDPHFHPIREILERPTVHQLRKIGVSACIYAMLILVCFGVTIKLVHLGGTVLPLKISSLEPVFEVPVDLLMSHIALPLTAHFVKPSATLKAAWKWWFKGTARALRLSSFLFGTRVEDEEGSIPLAQILHFKRRPQKSELAEGQFRPDGSFLRVPATDAIPLNHGRKQMLIPVTEDNRRLDGVEESEEARGDEDFRVVYVPPHFSTRICILFLWMWVYSVLLGLCVTLVPCTFPSFLLSMRGPNFRSVIGKTALSGCFWCRDKNARHLCLWTRSLHPHRNNPLY